MSKRALITGVTGQDGSYLAEILLDRDYEVFGLVRRTSSIEGNSRHRIDHIRRSSAGEQTTKKNTVKLVYGDLSDSTSLNRVFREVQPDEIYNLAGQSHPRISFEIPEHTANVDGLGTLRLLEAIRESKLDTKIYQAGTSELFGKTPISPQNESTAFAPCSPYAVSKLFAHWMTVNYRETYGMFAVNGILFNHESPRRGENFVTRKVSLAAARIKLGVQDKLVMGDLEARRDWGFSKDYMEAAWLMMQHSAPEDFVIATGETHSVRDLLHEAFGHVGLNWEDYVETDPRYLRPADVRGLPGDAAKARKLLGWQPRTSFSALIRMMVDSDLQVVKNELAYRSVIAQHE